jgi:L-ascorbate 6-phosphate lactonase
MSDLARTIRETQVAPGSLALFWLAQAGFVYKSPGGRVIYVDAYLSDCVHRLLANERYGFKRMSLAHIAPEEVEANWFVSTHAHPDHFDYDAIPVIARDSHTHFIAAPDCRAEFDKLGIPAARYTILHEGEQATCGDIRLTALYADHGPETPDALGMLVECDGIRVWQVGDTAFRPERWQSLFDMGVDVILPPINGAYGNLDARTAARLAQLAHARVAVPCHFWMFLEHGGDPAQFVDTCRELRPEVNSLIMSPGDCFICRRQSL